MTGDAYIRGEAKMVEFLDPALQEAVLTPEEDRTASQQSVALNALTLVSMDYEAVARDSSSDSRLEAIQLAAEMKDLDARILKTSGYRNQINYEYWDTLALAEQEARTVEARRLTFES